MSSKGGCFTQTKPKSAPLVRLGGEDDDVVEERVLHANRVQKRFAVLGGGDDDVAEGWLLHANQAQKHFAVLGGGDDDVVDGRVLHAN